MMARVAQRPGANGRASEVGEGEEAETEVNEVGQMGLISKRSLCVSIVNRRVRLAFKRKKQSSWRAVEFDFGKDDAAWVDRPLTQAAAKEWVKRNQRKSRRDEGIV